VSVFIGLLLGVRRLQRLLKRNPNYLKENPPTPEATQEWNNLINDLYTKTFIDIRDELDPQPVDAEERADFLKFLQEHEQEMAFCFFLYFPCLVAYKTSPANLYRKAIAGDTDAIDKLLRLDPLMQYEPTIGRKILTLRFSNKTNEYERLTAAPHKLAITNHTDVDAVRKSSKVEI